MGNALALCTDDSESPACGNELTSRERKDGVICDSNNKTGSGPSAVERFSERLRNKETRPEAITEAVVAVAVVGVGLWALGTLLTCAAPAVDTGRRRNKVTRRRYSENTHTWGGFNDFDDDYNGGYYDDYYSGYSYLE